jgi:FdhD protein
MGVTTDRRSIVRFVGGVGDTRADIVAVESPLTVVLDGEVLVTTMRTPGHDLDLAAGWLVNESGVRRSQHVTTMGAFATANGDEVDTVRVSLADGVRPPRARAFVTNSACGVCSADILAAVSPPDGPLRSRGWSLPAEAALGLIDRMREQQRMFDQTGALHAAALVGPDLGILWVREDVGRHNAVDKAIGHALFDDLLPLTDHVLVVSGRVSYEIVHKALTAGVSALVAVSGPTTLAVDLARQYDLVLIGFAREGRLNVYSGGHLVDAQEAS